MAFKKNVNLSKKKDFRVKKAKINNNAKDNVKRKKKITLSSEITPDYANEGINWFPGHMEKAFTEIQDKLKSVDIVLEIRDARIPLASGNELLGKSLGEKSRLILLNKVDLADPKIITLWKIWFKNQGIPHLFINCFEKGSFKKVLKLTRQIVDDKKKLSNPDSFKSSSQLKLMIVGIPNTGKSTIVNLLANRTATRTGDHPGHTKSQQWINVDNEFFLLDTPGLIPPDLKVEKHKLWLCAIHAVPDNVLGEELPAQLLLKYLIEIRSPCLLKRYKLDSFDLKIEEIIKKISIFRGCLSKNGLPDFDRVYKLILMDFRAGELGKHCFELPPEDRQPEERRG
ncbi:MAG: ribosome biogenesis GTPase YlqF [Oligoflexia bacterium]|nr:ribosome biogenesis GTPase YlqF [Oligoflexia bacterium]